MNFTINACSPGFMQSEVSLGLHLLESLLRCPRPPLPLQPHSHLWCQTPRLLFSFFLRCLRSCSSQQGTPLASCFCVDHPCPLPRQSLFLSLPPLGLFLVGFGLFLFVPLVRLLF